MYVRSRGTTITDDDLAADTWICVVSKSLIRAMSTVAMLGTLRADALNPIAISPYAYKFEGIYRIGVDILAFHRNERNVILCPIRDKELLIGGSWALIALQIWCSSKHAHELYNSISQICHRVDRFDRMIQLCSISSVAHLQC